MMRNSVKKLFLAACAVMVLGSCTVEECTRGLTLCALPKIDISAPAEKK